MGMLKLRNIFVCLLLSGSAAPTAWAEQGSAKFAVVELFTSEGCSSCPPADAALSDLIHDRQGTAVYALAMHVDYWNNLGWIDPFARAIFSERQQKYATAFHADNVYTPQVIVNGSVEFVGSDREKLKKAVDAALAAPAVATLNASAIHAAGNVPVAVSSTGLPRDAVICAAVVERNLSVVVERGENAGRTLKHENVTRAFASSTVDAEGKATVQLVFPENLKPENATIIIFAQRPTDMHILAATAIPFGQ